MPSRNAKHERTSSGPDLDGFLSSLPIASAFPAHMGDKLMGVKMKVGFK